MQDEITLAKKYFSLTRIQEQTYILNNFERTSSYSKFKEGVCYCTDELKKAGFVDVEMIPHIADGKHSVMDSIMPQAWERTERSFLEVVDGAVPEYDKVIADTDVSPFAAVIWSAPTSKEGLTGELIDYKTFDINSQPVKGKWFFIVYDAVASFPKICRDLANAGAAGIVMTAYRALKTAPNEYFWFNAQGFTGWYPTAEEKRIPIFSTSPLRGKRLEQSLRNG